MLKLCYNTEMKYNKAKQAHSILTKNENNNTFINYVKQDSIHVSLHDSRHVSSNYIELHDQMATDLKKLLLKYLEDKRLSLEEELKNL